MGIFRRIHNDMVRWAIRVTRRRPAPDTIPLSPPRAFGNDFYQAELYELHDSNKYMLIDTLSERGVEGIFFNGVGESAFPASIPNENLGLFRLEVRYYLRGYELHTKTAAMFLLQWLTYYPQFAIWRDRTVQFLFNRRRLVRQDRIELLRMFIAKTIEHPGYTTSATNLLHELHSLRGFSHPKRSETMNYYRLMLDSFVASGDLEQTQHAYRLSPRGVAGLAEFELEERRFKEGLKQQRLVGWLTIALVAVGIIQAYVTYISQ